MDWTILTPYEKVLIINLLPQVRINQKFIEARRLVGPYEDEDNYTVMAKLFGDDADMHYFFGGTLARVPSQLFKATKTWNELSPHLNEVLGCEGELSNDLKKLLAKWTIASISRYYIAIADLYFYQDSYADKVDDLTYVVKEILEHIHSELLKFDIHPDSPSMLQIMDMTRFLIEEQDWTMQGYVNIIERCIQYASDWYTIYPFAPKKS